MSPLLTASTTTTPQGERRPTSPSETGEVPWGYGTGLLGLSREVPEHQITEHVDLAITAEGRELPDWIFANTTGLVGLQSTIAYYRVDPSERLLCLRLLSGRGKAKWTNVAEPEAFLFPQIDILPAGGVVRVKPSLIGSESALPDQARPLAEGATGADLSNSRLEAYLLIRLNATFVEAVDEVFADGMESAFSRKVHSIIRAHGDVAIRAIDRAMQFERSNVEVAGEVLRQLGSIADPRTHHSRLTLLLRKLESLDPRIRDAASIGIAALDDPAAIGGIRRAIERERSVLLRRNLQLVLDQLQATQQ